MWIQILENIHFFKLFIITLHTLSLSCQFDLNNQHITWHHLTGTCEREELWLHSVFCFFFFFSHISYRLFIHLDQVSPLSVCVFMLCITNTCRGMLPSNLCSSLGLSRCVCLQDHITCALNNTHTPACQTQFMSWWAPTSACLLSQNSTSVSPAE